MYKYSFLFLLLGLCFLSSCDKVDELSDEAEITAFNVTKVTDGITLDQDRISIDNNIVTIPLEFGRKNFPMTISTDIRFSSTTDHVISTDEQVLNLKSFTFNDIYSAHEFYLISESGKPHLAKIQLEDKLNAEILEFNPNLPEESASVVIWHSNIRITLKKSMEWPLEMTPAIVKTLGATYLNYSDGETLTFESPADNTKQIIIQADNGDEKIWNIQILPSIENSDFELWINENNPQKINIDPVPGKGLGWATANNSFVQGTHPVTHEGNGYAAQMTTGIQNLSGLGIGELITAGTLFTGYFKMNLSALSNPPAMTYFGIPYILKPASVSFDAKYAAGNKLQQSVKESGTYKLHDLEGKDEGRMWIKLLYWEGENSIDYHEKPVENLSILGEGEMIFEGKNEALKNWNNYTVDIRYNPAYSHLEPTHIAIVFTSSRQGDKFIGAIGSMLTVDNIKINY